MRSLKAIFLFLCIVFVFSVVQIHAETSQPTSSAQLVQDEKVIYTLPPAGQVIPGHPLFMIKQIRDDIEDLLTRDPLEKAKLKLRYADRYIVYSQALADHNMPMRAVESIRTAISYQECALAEVQILFAQKDVAEEKQSLNKQFRFVLVQSNVKQSEIIRDLLNKLPDGEQETLLGLLEQSLAIRKQLGLL
ncbi:MAG: hypothetical protein WCO78_05495 [Candidatus Roizmanbacteria bacterium]